MLPSYAAAGAQASTPQASRPRVLILYSLNVETDHVLFALDALRFFAALAQKDNFALEATTNWEDLNDSNLKLYQLVVWLNEFPHNQAEREAFERYMTTGGAWLGFLSRPPTNGIAGSPALVLIATSMYC